MTSDQQLPGEATAPPTSARGQRRWPLAVLVALIAVAAVGGAAGLYLYDQATAIDRSEPTVTVQQFLTAVFVEKDQSRVGLFACPGLAPADAIAKAAGALDAEAAASWDTVVTEQQAASAADVSVRLLTTYPGELAPSGQARWVFHLEDSDGWRVCSFDTSR